MTYNAQMMIKVVIDGKDVFIPADSSTQKFIKVTVRDKETCMSEEDGVGLRDALLKVLPIVIAPPPTKLAHEIETIHMEDAEWRLVDGIYKKRSMMISRKAVEAVLPVFKPNEEIDAIEVAHRLNEPKTSQLTNKLAILAQVGKLVRRKDKLRTLFRLKQFEYKPPAGIIKIDSGTSEEILQGIKESQRKDLQAARER